LANQALIHWSISQKNAPFFEKIPKTIPKDWKKNSAICNDIIKACPFCAEKMTISR